MRDDFVIEPSASDPRNIHDGLGLHGSTRNKLHEGTRQRIPKLGYELRGEIGRGATASVFEARHIQTNRKVAIKVYDDPADDSQRRKFRGECHVLSSDDLAGNSVVPALYDCVTGEAAQDTQSLIIMEFIRGRKIHEYARAIPTVEGKIELCARLFDALHELHKAGVKYGDLSANNVLVEVDDRVRLVDFGQARTVKDFRSASSRSLALGTPGYTPDNVLEGQVQSEAWSDIHAAGAVAYQVLTGQIKGHDARESEPTRRAALINAGVPADVAAILVKALRIKNTNKSVDPRLHESAEVVAKELRGCLERRAARRAARRRRRLA